MISAENSGSLFKNLIISLIVINIQIFSLHKMWANLHFFIVFLLKMQFVPLALIIHHILSTLLYTFG